MAESVVVYLVDKLSSLVAQEAGLLGGVAEKVVSLRDEMNWIQCLVRDADKKRRMSPLVDIWMTELIDLAYDAEDVIDTYILHLERIQHTAPNWFCCRTLTKIISTPTLHSLGLKIEKINTRARLISARKSDYDLQLSDPPQINSTEQNLVYRRRGVTTVEEKFHVVGFQQELAQVASWLMDEAHQARQVVSIVGMGGLGKTTLAQKVYRNVIIHFSFQIWITVSQQYQVRDLLLSALKQINPSDYSHLENMDTEDLKEKLYTHLDNKRYLVVMDDIWIVEAWEQISAAFPNNHNGSRVLLTTRNKEVALRAASSNCLDLRLLDRDESWELFCKKVFSASGGDCPLELVQLGKAIVDKCSGLPLAILVIGGLLMGKGRTPNAWSRVLDSVTWHLSQDSNECHQILILSYIDLPYHLKLCFLYLGLFPEDYEIKARRLIRLWVAEGFVQGRGDEMMENVAEDHLEELIQRSMIQVTDRLYYGGPVSSYRVHDLLRDVAVSEGRKDKFLDIHQNNNTLFMTRPPRRLAIHPRNNNGGEQEGQLPLSPTNLKFLRSIINFDESFKIGIYLKSTFGNGKCILRVLDLGDAQIGKRLTKEIGKFVSLRYLQIGDYETEKLPSSISNLQKLETLDIQATGIKSLPWGIFKLKNLRHLFLNRECYEFKGNQGCVSIEDFGRDILTLKVNVFFMQFLVRQRCLRTLEVISGKVVVTTDQLRSWLPSSLIELYLGQIYIEQDPSGVLGGLPNLKILVFYISSYTGSEMVFPSRGFLQLQSLYIQLKDLQEWRVGNGAVPNLVDLWIFSERLNRLPDGLRNVSTLQRIELKLDHLKDRLRENGEEWDKIKHIPLKILHTSGRPQSI